MLQLDVNYRGIAAASVLAACVVLLLLWGSSTRLPHSYTYFKADASNNVELHALISRPGEITLQSADGPLSNYSGYGINGGFFYEKDLLSIAAVNDKPVGGTRGQYGSGWFNVKYPRGTLVWDEAAGAYSVQVVSSVSDIHVKDRERYFAQGGVSMNLMNENVWEYAAEQEHLPYPDEKRLRSALVYGADQRLWLIATPTLCTAAEFRQAILETIEPGMPKEGIFLDGDGSAQLNSAESRLTGDSRVLRQIIIVK
ncbi:hypothetical protein EJP77_19200 [Paenibacillus zeisoli]|uniref:Phosphodiester glycosidase domain-containing protein n=1 Tax=Paenibacillus zeisoli TaxID=2496267 RepID=A0A3S1D3E5_9BACL|nr:hypothetical protein [Paenibacillus zeisoli]RUT27961.1 hypothetical protein EJP77_19200 [Paenibacillus zeisoli]